MKKFTTIVVSIILGLSALAQEPVITMTSDKTPGSAITLNMGGTYNKSIQIDFGDGLKKSYTLTIGNNYITGSLGSSQTIKIYTIDGDVTDLTCDNNGITTLDFAKCNTLTYISCDDNKLTSLDFTHNTALTSIHFDNNELAELDITKNINLKYLNCFRNKLEKLDVTSNPELTNLLCSYNPIKVLDISKNTKLEILMCSSMDISKLDISANPLLTVLDCEGNRLTYSSLPLNRGTFFRYTYLPQKELQIPTSISVGATLDLSSEYLINGNITTYKWEQPGMGYTLVEGIDYTIASGKITFLKCPATPVLCIMTNSSFPPTYTSDYLNTTFLNILKPQTITFNALPVKKLGDAAFELTATASSNLAVTFTSSDPSIASVSGKTVTINKAGVVKITATQAGDSRWDAAPSVTQTLTINKATQTITFNTLPAKKANDAAFNLSATATSALAVTFTSSDPSIALVSGNTVTIKKAGSVTITASQAGDDIWGAATSVTQTLTINKVTQTLTFSTLPAKKANDAAFNLSATATSGLAVTFTSSDPSIASVSGNTVTIKKAGSVTITASQAGDDIWSAATSVTQTLTINKAMQTITFNTLPAKKANDVAFNLSATATSGLAVTFTSSDPSIASVSGNTVTINKAGSVTITASQTGDDNWSAATSVTQTLTISKVDQTILFEALPTKKLSDAAFTISATAASGLAVTFESSDPSIASVSGNTVTLKKIGTVSITASQAGNDIWNAISATQKLTITADQLATQTQTITFNALPAKNANDTPFTISATATSGLAVTFTSSDPSIASVSGNTITIKKAGSVTITADQVGDNTWAPAASVAQTLTIGKNAQTITFNTIPAKKVGDAAFELTATASSGLAVTFSSSDPSVASISGSTVTILKAGTVTITATQAGNNNWGAATAEQSLTITPTTSIDEEKENIFSVYPNPAADMLYFKGEGSDNMTVSIFNLLGTKVWSGMVKGQRVDISQLPAGVYILKTSNNKETQTIRFVKQ